VKSCGTFSESVTILLFMGLLSPQTTGGFINMGTIYVNKSSRLYTNNIILACTCTGENTHLSYDNHSYTY